MSDTSAGVPTNWSITPNCNPSLYTETRQISGDIEAFIRLFGQMAGRHKTVRITHEHGAGVVMRFEGHWSDGMRVVDGDSLSRMSERSEIQKRIRDLEFGYTGTERSTGPDGMNKTTKCSGLPAKEEAP